MAKKGLGISEIKSVIKDVKNTSGWSLCIGSGTSKQLIPDWYELVDGLIKHNCADSNKIDIKTYKGMGFSADAMIQAVKNNLRLNDKEFIKLLSNELYNPIKEKLTQKEWGVFCKVHEDENEIVISDKVWKVFWAIRDKLFVDISANLIAEVLIKAIKEDIGPKTILTFNGEAILLALLRSYYIETLVRGGSKEGNKQMFGRVVNSINGRNQGRIPYIHCHGVIPINGVAIKKGRIADDKLVFSEDKYLEIANTSFSWQSSNFINACINSKVIFIGVSLTDVNMRKWLTWIHNNKIQELKENKIDYINSTEHFWINRKPKTETEKLWIEETVSHLGIRLVWIDEWNQIGIVLRKMLGI